MPKIIIGHPIIRLDEVDSTNTFASRFIKNDNAEEGTVILAEYQNKGRGQKGSNWESEKGMNLTFSFILRPEFLEAQKQFYILMSVSLGIVDVINLLGVKSFIKWPNDIFINNRKTGGILIENYLFGNKISATVVGVGINVNQTLFAYAGSQATSLKIETKLDFDRNELFHLLLNSLNKWIGRLYGKKYDIIRKTYLKHLLLYNQWAEYIDAGGKMHGCIRGVSEEGQLLVEDQQGNIRNYGFKEIEYTQLGQ